MVKRAARVAWRGILGLLARPVRRAQGRRGAGQDGVVVQPYRGYGSRREVFVIGRVFRQGAATRRGGPLRRQIRDIARRLTRRAVPEAAVTARFHGGVQHLRTDADGYFRVHLRPAETPPDDRLWHWMEVSVTAPEPAEARVAVFIPPPKAGMVVVSDIDDTVMYTGVANTLAMLWRLFLRSAEDREAFPGVARFYEALHGGPDGEQGNPILYVSRAPWGLYDMLDAFFSAHRIPVGPILFLREWGLSWRRPWPRRAVDHKRALIDHMMTLYGDLPFVLIGDSGQHDPEVYRHLIAAYPGRIPAVYIRDVSRGPGRRREIAAMAEAARAAGTSLVLAADSAAMADHAASLGLIPRPAVAAVRAAQAGGRVTADRPVR